MKEKLEILKKYARIIAKYAFYAFVAITIINLAILYCLRGSEFRTLGYTINSYAFRVLVHLLPLWIGYLIYKILNVTFKKSPVLFCVAFFFIWPLIGLFAVTFFFGFFGSYGDGSYDECMEMCVNEDQSNFDECTFSTCDFPI